MSMLQPDMLPPVRACYSQTLCCLFEHIAAWHESEYVKLLNVQNTEYRVHNTEYRNSCTCNYQCNCFQYGTSTSCSWCWQIYYSGHFNFYGPKWHSRRLLPFQGQKSLHFPPPSSAPCNGFCPHQNHYILRHINNRYINSCTLVFHWKCGGVYWIPFLFQDWQIFPHLLPHPLLHLQHHLLAVLHPLGALSVSLQFYLNSFPILSIIFNIIYRFSFILMASCQSAYTVKKEKPFCFRFPSEN